MTTTEEMTIETLTALVNAISEIDARTMTPDQVEPLGLAEDIRRTCQETLARLHRAKKDGVSSEELARRNAAMDKVTSLRAFTMREARARLAD